jgi:hypothetical protein
MFIEMKEGDDDVEVKSDFPKLGSFVDLKLMGLRVEHTKRGVACTELVGSFPFALTWQNAEERNTTKARKHGDGEYRYVFCDGFLQDDHPRHFSISYLG